MHSDILRNHAAGFLKESERADTVIAFAEPIPDGVEPPAKQPIKPIDRSVMSMEPAPSRYTAPTLVLFAAIGFVVVGLYQGGMWFWFAGSAVLCSLVLIRSNYVNRIDIRKQRELIAQAQGKNNEQRI